MSRSFVTAFAALLFLTSISSEAEAQQNVLAAVVFNNTHLTIPYQIRVGNGPWTTYRLARGKRLAYSFPYPASNTPVVYIRYDNDLTTRVNLLTTTLVMHVCKRPGDGWLQTFTVINSGRNVALMR